MFPMFSWHKSKWIPPPSSHLGAFLCLTWDDMGWTCYIYAGIKIALVYSANGMTM
jgi:hypothetical protein